MKINPNIFRGYDIRGLVDKDLNPKIAEHIGKAFGVFLSRKGIKKAVVGFDSRATSPEYSQAVIKGLTWAGVDVINIGLNLIGTFYWSQYYLNCRGGVYVTASHNPVEYNGFKLANDFSETLVYENLQELKQMIEREDYEQDAKNGSVQIRDIRQEYFADLLKKLPITKRFKIVIDPSHSTAGVIAPELLKKAGCQVVESNSILDSSFPLGTPDPTSMAVASRLREKVLQENADLGFSYDADGDRIGIVDDKGNIIWNDVLVALFAADVLREHPNATIMYNTLCSKAVEETILKHGGKPFMWRTGHSFLKKKNQEVKAAFIGELSGHFFFSADFYNHDDGLYSTLRLLSYLAKTNQSLSSAIAAIPKYISSPEIKIYSADEYKVDLIKKINPALKKDFSGAQIIDDERAGDGVRVDFEDAMFVIRYSQNAPYLTIKFEAKTDERYNYLKKYISKLLHSYQEVDWLSSINLNLEALK
ncbi:MAG: phosphomannomutase/phosphoglucomutase [Candidatus Nealsonbacteria bacterium]|nr:phosphomannomutase/phosphoglucomutase [Candidatus Nealsonbacteria bacterium]